MNLFPIVSALILILSISTYAIMEKARMGSHFPKSFTGYMTTYRKVQNSQENAYCPKTKEKETLDHAIPPPKPKKKKTPILNCKINLYPLFTQEHPEKSDLYAITARLIKSLYSHFPFYKDKLEYTLLDHIILAAKESEKNKQTIRLERLNLSSDPLQFFWYKILRGSKAYKNQPLVKFSNFVVVDDQQQKTICVPYCGREILSSIFNDKIADEILAEEYKTEISKETGCEKKKYKPITKETLEKILANHHFLSEKPKILEILSFNKETLHTEKVTTETDLDTKITCSKTQYHSS